MCLILRAEEHENIQLANALAQDFSSYHCPFMRCNKSSCDWAILCTKNLIMFCLSSAFIKGLSWCYSEQDDGKTVIVMQQTTISEL